MKILHNEDYCVVEIWKDNQHALITLFIAFQFLDLTSYFWICHVTKSTPYLTISVNEKLFRLNDGFENFVLCIDFESLLLCPKEDVDLYAHLFDFYISLHLEQFDVHGSSNNVSRDLNCEVSIF